MDKETNERKKPVVISDIIFKYFPDLSDKQKEQFNKLFDLYSHWTYCFSPYIFLLAIKSNKFSFSCVFTSSHGSMV